MYWSDFFENPQQFLQTWAVRLPGSGNDGGAIPGRAGDFMPVTADVAGRRRRVNRGYNIAANTVYVAFRKVLDGELELVVRGTNKHASVGSSIPNDEWFEAFLLPWNQGCAARMQLPNQTRVNAFFTAEMNGCSFIAAGDPHAPLVAHVNVGDVANTTERERMWMRMYNTSLGGQNIHQPGMRQAGALRKWGVPGGGGAAVGGAPLAAQNAPTYESQGAEVTTASTSFRQSMDAKGIKEDPNSPRPGLIHDLKVSMMGIRDDTANTWRLFYQRNLFVSCTDTKKKLGKMGGLIKFFGRDNRQVSRYERYMRIAGSEYIDFWPTAGHAVLTLPPGADDDLDLGGIGL